MIIRPIVSGELEAPEQNRGKGREKQQLQNADD